jgi:hypothetical protein
LAEERGVRTRPDWHGSGVRYIENPAGVAYDLLERGIARDAGNSDKIKFRMGHRVKHCESIIDAGVQIE